MGGITPMLTIPDAICNAERFRCINVQVTATGTAIMDPGDAFFQGHNHVIFWTLPTGFTFPSDGISIADASGPSNEFTCRAALQGRVFFCVNRHSVGSSSDPKRYKYTIKVNEISASLDPHVVNN
jgi:hypothetical protein